jgi:hypothetical protein
MLDHGGNTGISRKCGTQGTGAEKLTASLSKLQGDGGFEQA